MIENEIEHSLVEKAKRVLPGGTFGNFPGDVVIREGRGGRVWDESGKEYVDFLLGSGPMLVGHAHPEVTAAAQAQIAQGTTFFANNRWGIELAEAIVEAVPCAEQVRFVSTGSEADLYAMRAARAFTKRDKILKFEGGYHGMSDYSLMSLAPKRPGNFPQPIPDSAGIPRSVRDEMLVAPFNDLEVVAGLVREHRRRTGRRHRRAVPAHHPARTRLSRRPAQDHGGARHPADLRRGRHRLSLRLWRRAGILRRHARSLHARQGDRRRLPARGDRRPGGHHGAFRPRQGRRRRLPDADRHPLGQSGRGRRRACDAGDPAAPRRLRAHFRHRPRADGHARRAAEARGRRRRR